MEMQSAPGPSLTVQGQTDKAEDSESPTSQRKNPYLTTFPMALMRFASAHRSSGRGFLGQKVSTIDESSEGPCGLGRIIIPQCQRFNNIKCFLILYCILVTSQGIVFGLMNLSTANVEKEYNVETSEKLALDITYDVSSALVAIFVGYYGGRGRRTIWIAASSLLVGFGSLLVAFPYLSAKVQKPKIQTEDICQRTKVIDYCLRSKDTFLSKYVLFFVLGQIVQGTAGMPLYVLGVTFLENSVATHSAGIYLGIGDASGLLGYGFGYALGAPQLKASDNSTSEKSITNSDVLQWQRNWCINFLVAALIAWSTFIPFLCFPYSIPGTAKINAEKHKHFIGRKIRHKDKEFGASIKDLFAALRILMTNPSFVFPALCRATESLVSMGAAEFLPKYLENQFLLTPSVAAMLTGIILVPGGAFGSLLGGVAVSFLKLSCKALMRFTMVTSVLSIMFLGLIVFVHCETVKFAGINEDYYGTGQLGNLTAPCNENCRCSTLVYSSVCGRDEIEYFSPCFAGCAFTKTLNQQKAYYSCSCIKEGLTSSDAEGDFIDAIPGKCNRRCYTLPLFFAFIFCSILFSAFCRIPLNLTILRVVPDKLHSLALGLTFVFVRILGTIPGPLLFKMAAETSCTFWDVSKCGHRKHCWLYDKSKMVFILVGIWVLCKICTVFFIAFGFYTYKNLVREGTDSPNVRVKNVKANKKETTNL